MAASPGPELLLAHGDFVRGLARQLLGDPDAADDAAQDAWVRALRRPPRHAGNLRAWLGAIVRNVVRNRWRDAARRQAREAAVLPPEAAVSAADVAAREELRRRVVEAVLALDEPYRSTVLSRFYEDLPPREIAERQGVPVATVKTRLSRGLARLREVLDGLHGGDRRTWCVALLPIAGLAAAPRSAAAATVAGGGMAMGLGGKLAVAGVVLALAGVVAWRLAGPGDAPRDPETARAPALGPAAGSGESATGEAAATPPDGAAGAGTGGETRPQAAPESPPAPDPNAPAFVGRVLFPDGTPAADASAEASWHIPGGEGRWERRAAECDDAGAYRLTGAAVGPEIWVSASHPDFAPAEGHRLTAPASGESRVPDLTLRLGSRVSGRVLDAVGTPVAGARIGRTNELTFTDRASYHAPTDDAPRSGPDGRWADGPWWKGRWVFWAAAPGFAPGVSAPVDCEPGVDVDGIDLVLEPAGFVAGRVIDELGQPVEGATVVAWGAKGVLDFVKATATTDVEGRFRVEGLVPGWQQVNARADGYGSTRKGADTGREDLVLTIERRARAPQVLLQVRDARGAPVDAVVVASGWHALGDKALERLDTGRYRLRFGQEFGTAPPGGSVTLSVVLGDGRRGGPEQVAIPPEGGPPTCEITVLDGVRVTGVVVAPGGRPIAGARVRYGEDDDMNFAASTPARWPGVTTDADGQFSLQIADGTWALRVTAQGFEPWKSPVAPAAELTRWSSIGLARPIPRATVRGRLLDGAAKPVAQTYILLMETTRQLGRYIQTKTDDTGQFEFREPLRPGEYHVSVQFGGLMVHDVATLTVVAEPGEPVEVRFPPTLRVEAVHGVVARGGRPLGGVTVGFWPENDEWGSGAEAISDHQGRFSLPALPAAGYLVGVSPGAREPALSLHRVRMEPGGEPLRLDANPGSIAGQVVVPPGADLGRDRWLVTLEPRVSDRTTHYSQQIDPEWVRVAPDGSFRFEHIPPATYRLLLWSATHVTAGPPLTVPPGGEVRPTLVATPAVQVRGRVVDARGAPVAGATVEVRAQTGEWINRRDWHSVETGPDGRFDGGQLRAGPLRVAVYAPNAREPAGFDLSPAAGEIIDRDFAVR